jgi:periplasmic protein CpxP/Spy
MLRKYIIASACCALLYAVPIFAQDTGDTAQQPGATQSEGGHGRRHFDPAKRTEELTKKLNLNADQQAKVKDILTNEQSQMQGLHSDTSMAQSDRRAKMMDIHKSSDDQIWALLDSTQQQKWDKMQAKREQKMEKHHGGDGTMGSTQQQ